jgi:hypothetical protein
MKQTQREGEFPPGHPDLSETAEKWAPDAGILRTPFLHPLHRPCRFIFVPWRPGTVQSKTFPQGTHAHDDDLKHTFAAPFAMSARLTRSLLRKIVAIMEAIVESGGIDTECIAKK